jgi:hypothetical protein
VFYAASPKCCGACGLRVDCLRAGSKGVSPRKVSLLYYRRDGPPDVASAPVAVRPPTRVGPFPLLWRDGQRCGTRRKWMSLLRSQTVTLTALAAPSEPVCPLGASERVLTLAQRKHWRLSWDERLARNAAASPRPLVHLQVFGIPEALAALVGVASAR